MALTWTRHTVAVTGLGTVPATWDAVDVLGIHVPSGERYGSCMLGFPKAYGFADLPAEGAKVAVALDTIKLFEGTVVGFPGGIGGDGEQQQVKVVDARWQLGKIRVGDTAHGDFEVVGRRIAFNFGGRADRAAEKEVDEEEVPAAAYGWDKGPAAVPWTRADVLEWILATCAPGLLAPGSLDGPWLEPTWNFVPYGYTVGQAISALAAECGESWGLHPQASAAPLYVRVKPGGSSAFVVALPAEDAFADAADAAANSLVTITGGGSIEGATDAVEVHGGPVVVETTYRTDGEAPLLVPIAIPDTSRYAAAYGVDVTAYAAQGLGADDVPILGTDLQAGARAKPWRRELVSRYDAATGDLYEALSIEAEAGVGSRLKPEDCLWVTANGERRRVVAGFEIRLADAQILFGHYLALETDDPEAPEEFYAGDGIEPVFFTVATETERATVARETVTEIVAGERATEMVLRLDVVAETRYKCDVREPSLGVGSFVSFGLAAEEPYIDAAGFLEDVALSAITARKRKETWCKVRCLDLTTAVALGRKLEISPAATGLDVDTVIVDVFYDLAQGRDMIVVTATNNLEAMI
jgi:hypothetical protein